VEARIRPLDGDQRLPAAFPSDGIPAHSGLNGSGWRREGSEPGHVVLRTFEQGNPTFAFARIGAVVAMRVEDYYPKGKRWWVRLHEKGGKRHEMPAHHNLEAYLDAYIEAAGIRNSGFDTRDLLDAKSLLAELG
jgi:hypothetical protein